MNALEQYITLYHEAREAIDAHSCELLNRLRPEALKALEGARLPRKGDEGFEKTSVEEMFAPDYGINIQRVNIPVDVAASFRCDVPNLSTWLGVTVNDAFHPTATLEGKLPEGVLFCSLSRAAKLIPDVLAEKYGSLAPLDNAAVALNTLLAQDGVCVYVPRGVQLEKPLQLVNIFSSPTPLLAFRRMVVIVEDDASAQLLVCDHTQVSRTDSSESAPTAYMSSQVIEVFAGRNASFSLCDIEESSATTSRYSQLFAHQEQGAQLVIDGVSLTSGTTRNDYDIHLAGEHCDTRLAGMVIGSDSQHIDNCSRVFHQAPHCRSNQMFKYVLTDKSQGAFEGGIEVDRSAPFTEAYQSNRNLLASTDARMHTMPQLLIYNDDVKCSHGATTGQLDQDALFYMRSRGIPEQEARVMLMQAFMSDVIDTVTIPGLQDRLRHLVERRFTSPEGFCHECASCHDITPEA